MDSEVIQCRNPECGLLRQASELKCWWCGYVEDIAAYEQSRTDLTPQEKGVWGLIGVGALLFGLYKFVEFVADRA
jgi:hypothetical protein